MGQSVTAECKTCGSSSPAADTVRVDANIIAPDSPTVQKPVQAAEAEVQPQGETDEEARRSEEEARLAEERRQQLEVERLRQEEEHRREKEEQEEAERQRQEEAARAERVAREESERVAEAERMKAEQARAVAAKESDEAAVAQRTVDDFLRSHGFKNLGVPRKAGCGAFCGGSVYPLHLAVEENEIDVVMAMLRCGADKSVKNSGKKTPLEVAERRNKTGSHDLVVAALRGGA